MSPIADDAGRPDNGQPLADNEVIVRSSARPRDAEYYYHPRRCGSAAGIIDGRIVPEYELPDEYKRCVVCHSGHAPYARGECRNCGRHIGDGECDFCRAFDAIHAVPRDAELAADGGQP